MVNQPHYFPNPTDGQFMMSGYLNGGKAVTITAGTNGAGVISESNVIRLYRILAKNTFTIEAGNGLTFTPVRKESCIMWLSVESW